MSSPQSERIASSTHRGIGIRPVSQRATVTRWTPRDAARPDCVSPASVRRVRRVSGRIATMVLAPARAFTFTARRIHATGCASFFVAGGASDFHADGDMGPFVAKGRVVGLSGVVGVERNFAASALKEGVCVHAPNVARRYTGRNNLYQTRGGNF